MRLPFRRPAPDDFALLAGLWARLRDDKPDDVVALWFGITDDRTVYVAGGDWFDPDDDDWAADLSWWPDGAYVTLPGLAALPGYEAVAARVAELVARLRPWADVDGVVAVASGYDDGDLTLGWTAP